MPASFNVLREEGHPAVRVVLGHFIFAYIHPFVCSGRSSVLRSLSFVIQRGNEKLNTSLPAATATYCSVSTA